MCRIATKRLAAYRAQIEKHRGNNLRMAREYFKYYKAIPLVRNDRDRLIDEALQIYYANGGVENAETSTYLIKD